MLLSDDDLGEDLDKNSDKDSNEDSDEDLDDDFIKIMQVVSVSRKPAALLRKVAASEKCASASKEPAAKLAATKPKWKCTRKVRVSSSSGSRPSTPQTKKRVGQK